MAVTVKLPTILRKHAGNEAKVSAEGSTLVEVLKDLESRYPGITKNVTADDGGLHRFINVYLTMRTFDISGRSRRPCPTATPCPSSPPSRAADRPGAGPRSQTARAAPTFGPGAGPFGACAALGAHVALTRPDGEGS